MSHPTKNPRWFLAPLYSRGEFSPRLLMAWQAFYLACWMALHYVCAPAVLLKNGQVIQPVNPLELVLGFLGLVGSLLALGTFQKVRLDGPPPAPETDNSTTIKADTAPVQADTVNVNTAPGP